MKPTPTGWPRISSALYYDDAAKAIDWLCRAFGFEVQLKVEGDEFVDCVLHGKKPVADGRVGTSVVRALEAIEKSLRARGAEVEVET